MDTSITIAQDNALTNSKQPFSVIEKRCLYQVIYEVRKTHIDTSTGEKDLFENMYIRMSASSLQRLGDEVQDVYRALKTLRKKDIEIETDNEWVLTSWILEAKHNKKKGTYEVLVSREIMPYLVELAKNFTAYDLTVAIALKSTYSQRFYELCNQYKNRNNRTFFLSVKQMREMFNLEKKYQNGNDFKKRVLDIAQKELKDLYDQGQCDLYFEYVPKEKEGRKVLSYFFFIHTKSEEKPVDCKIVDDCVRRITQILKIFFPRDKKFIVRVINAVKMRPDIAFDLVDKLEKKVLDYEKSEIPPIIRFVLSEDFGIV